MNQDFPTSKLNQIWLADSWPDYELIDSGHRQKLERLGEWHIIRPEPIAIWEPKLSFQEWQNKKLGAIYQSNKASVNSGQWFFKNPQLELFPPRLFWRNPVLNANDSSNQTSITFQLKFMPSRHLGLFPEHASQWQWLSQQITASHRPLASQNQDQAFKFLNLFGFTGGASLVASQVGAHTTHVDSSYEAISLGRQSQELSGLQNLPIRWIKDDVMKFVDRELKRRPNFYDGIILDPPAHGHGTKKGEVWDLNSMLPELLNKLVQLLSPQAQFLILNTYTQTKFSPDVFAPLTSRFPNHQFGQLGLPQTTQPEHPLLLSRSDVFSKALP